MLELIYIINEKYILESYILLTIGVSGKFTEQEWDYKFGSYWKQKKLK